jgi:ABC-type multidrug transport system ATPase subunit
LLLALREHTQRGATVLFSSHSLNEVQTLCDRIAVIHQGRVVREGSVAALTGATQSLSVWSRLPLETKAFDAWKIHAITSKHHILEGEHLLQTAIPKLMPFGIERLEFGGMGLERLLEEVHQTTGGKA